jgi:hypothetical protein
LRITRRNKRRRRRIFDPIEPRKNVLELLPPLPPPLPEHFYRLRKKKFVPL